MTPSLFLEWFLVIWMAVVAIAVVCGVGYLFCKDVNE
jgi:hypothetical protein